MLNLHKIQRNSLFYNQYCYSIRFTLPELGVIRGLKYEKIDKIVTDRNFWRTEHLLRYNYRQRPINDQDTENLKTVCGYLISVQDQIKLAISYDYGYVYTNNIDIIQKIHDLECIKNPYIQQVQVTGSPNTVALKNPTWSHRTYFRSKTLTDQQRATLVDYLSVRENIRLSPGLRQWLGAQHVWAKWLQDYYFFDHNNDGEVLFLNMVIPRITGRTLDIVAK